MCGLIGAFRTKNSLWNKNIKEYMGQGLLISMLRGMQGAGVGLALESGATESDKTHTDAFHFINSDKYAWLENKFSGSMAILGHTRYPTIQNSVKTLNSQPFEYYHTGDEDDWYMLTHNGHVTNYHSLTPTSFSHQVDSAHVAWAFAAEGPNKVLKKLKGSYVLVWYHVKSRTFNIAKNEKRDLYVAIDKSHKAIYYASEEAFLRFLCDRNGIQIDGEISEVPPWEHISWNLEAETLDKPNVRKFEEEKEKYPSYTHSSTSLSSNAQWVTKGDYIWVQVSLDDNLKPHTDKEGVETTYGYVYGTRPMYGGSVCKITGIKSTEWETKWKYLRPSGIPMKVMKTQELKDDKTGNKYMYYEGCINLEQADIEIKRKQNSGTIPIAIAAETPKLPDLTDDEKKLVPGPIYDGSTTHTLISLKEWRQLALQGCYFCETKIKDSEVGHVKFFTFDLNNEDVGETPECFMICPECAKDERKMEAISA